MVVNYHSELSGCANAGGHHHYHYYKGSAIMITVSSAAVQMPELFPDEVPSGNDVVLCAKACWPSSELAQAPFVVLPFLARAQKWFAVSTST